MNLFVDANIFLSFYDFKYSDIQQLNKIKDLLLDGSIKIFINKHLIDEINRNRESLIVRTLQNPNMNNISAVYPYTIQDNPDFEELINLNKEYNKALKKIKDSLIEKFNNNSLNADILIKDIIKPLDIHDSSLFYFKASERENLGNPPLSYGDKIHWEYLLGTIPNGQDLHIVSSDSDFKCEANNIFGNTNLKKYLIDEWNNIKKSNVKFYRNIQEFIDVNNLIDKSTSLPIKISYNKKNDIEKLAKSPNYMSTHKYISELNKYSDFNKEELNLLLSAAINNTQISDIINDDDVNLFYQTLCNKVHDLKDKDTELSKKAVEVGLLIFGF